MAEERSPHDDHHKYETRIVLDKCFDPRHGEEFEGLVTSIDYLSIDPKRITINVEAKDDHEGAVQVARVGNILGRLGYEITDDPFREKS